VAKLLPAEKGLQLTCTSEGRGNNAKRAQVWSFANGCEQARLRWEREFTVYGEHSAPAVGRYDPETMAVFACTWGGIVILRPSDGADLFRLYWECAPGQSGKRNYGSLLVTDLDGAGQTEVVILARAINLHITVLSPWRGAAGAHAHPEKPLPAPAVPLGDLASYPAGPMLWQRYFGDAQPAGAFLLDFPHHPVADVDGDGKQEIVANVRTDQWTLKVYDGMTGMEKLSRPGVRAEAVWDLDGDGIGEIVGHEGEALVIGGLERVAPPPGARWMERFRRRGCAMPYARRPVWRHGEVRLDLAPISLSGQKGSDWVLSQGSGGILQFHGRPGAAFSVHEIGQKHAAHSEKANNSDPLVPLCAAKDRLVATKRGTPQLVLQSAAGVTLASWRGGSPFYTGVAVADLDGDGRNELVIGMADGRVAAWRVPRRRGAALQHLWSASGTGFAQGYPVTFPVPLIADMYGDGRRQILVGGAPGGRLLDGQGRTLWQTELPLTRAVFADFNGDGVLDIYAAALVAPAKNDPAGARLHSYALDGRNGSILWHNDGSAPTIWHHQLGPTPTWAMPTVCDLNGDGIDDVLFVALDLLIDLNGKNGTFLHEPVIANRIWAQQKGQDTQWTAYGTQVPADLNGDGKLAILLTSSWGQWGAWTLDRRLLWTFDPTPARLARRHPGVADVDGDGRLEFGVIHDDGAFRCYDATTGNLKWELPNVRQASDVVTADVDGDGRPEFVASLAAYKALDTGQGILLWELDAPVSQCPPVVADVDGDGRSEILVGCLDGGLRVYK
jgi:hypothetical protein